MKKCGNCKEELKFTSVLYATNPLRIKCGSCQEKIKVSLHYGVPILLLVIGLAFALWQYTEVVGLTFKQSVIVMIALGIFVEYLYFEGLRRGLVKSTLTNIIAEDVKDSINEVQQQEYKVYPRLKHVKFLEALPSQVNESNSLLPITEKLVGDLLLSYAIDIGDNFVALSEATAKEFNIDLNNVRSVSEMNSLDFLRHINFETNGKVKIMSCPNHLISATILFPALWDQIEEEIKGNVIVAFAHRDVVIYGNVADEGVIQEIHSVIESLDYQDPHYLSKKLYTRKGLGWEESTS